jgi:ferrous iron transport protein B
MKVGLFGNPNTGKSSIFNLLTGLRQQVGNFPGVTVDKRHGKLISQGIDLTITDFPGCYSIYPRSADEQVVYEVLSNPEHPDFPNIAIVVIDQSNLERNLFLFTQIYDLNIPCIMVLNRMDVSEKRGVQVDLEGLMKEFPGFAIVQTNARVGMGKDRLLQAINRFVENPTKHAATNSVSLAPINDTKQQEAEAESRYKRIQGIAQKVVSKINRPATAQNRLDRLLVHPFWGYLIFASILLVVFQFIFTFAKVPMEFIDSKVNLLATYLQSGLPSGVFTDLLSQGIIPGIGGILVFVPQIAILFFFIAILEQSGYLARVVFIMDRLMRPLGLNGKSVVPLLSSVACAIPGVMATRTIADWKERMITILVAPFMSCSARIPVYTLLIALVIPQKTVFGFIELQGLVLFALYMLGLISALLFAWILKHVLTSRGKGFLMLELPAYQYPIWKNVGYTVWEKVRIFVWDAGRVILAISVLLWALASFGPGGQMDEITLKEKKGMSIDKQKQEIASAKLEQSYIGHFGRFIEPILEPLGYDWKIGIALITSFAAREVFVGSLATIYAVQNDDANRSPLMEQLRKEKDKDGNPIYSMATGISLMVFYAFAMQCMATLAVVKRETKSWKWPLLQLFFMGVLAYVSALATFQLMN